MKTLNKISQILSVVFGLGSLVLFFTPFANVTVAGTDEPISRVGASLAFGTSVADSAYDLTVSSHILFVFIVSIIAALMSVFAYKAKGLRYSTSLFALISAVYMWVIALCEDGRFVDTQAISGATAVEHVSVIYIAIAMLAFAVFAIAYLFIDDYIEAKASKEKKTICQRVVLFFRDNKSEIKKISWPGLREVIKNTITVIVICLIIGALIWLIDGGLGALLKLILG